MGTAPATVMATGVSNATVATATHQAIAIRQLRRRTTVTSYRHDAGICTRRETITRTNADVTRGKDRAHGIPAARDTSTTANATTTATPHRSCAIDRRTPVRRGGHSTGRDHRCIGGTGRCRGGRRRRHRRRSCGRRRRGRCVVMVMMMAALAHLGDLLRGVRTRRNDGPHLGQRHATFFQRLGHFRQNVFVQITEFFRLRQVRPNRQQPLDGRPQTG